MLLLLHPGHIFCKNNPECASVRTSKGGVFPCSGVSAPIKDAGEPG